MASDFFEHWRRAELEAHEAVLELQAALALPGHVPPDDLFTRWRERRAAADDALREFMWSCEHELALVLPRVRLRSGSRQSA